MSENSTCGKFSFPFQPYNIQEEFMTALHDAYDGKKLGIFESPTGTGKSLSLICGTLSWLHSHLAEEKENLEKCIAASKENDASKSDDWFSAYCKQAEKSDQVKSAERQLNVITKQEDRIKKLKLKKNKNITETLVDKEFEDLFKESDKIMNDIRKEMNSQIEDSDLVLDDYSSDAETADDDEEEDEGVTPSTKVYFCSRTHSQLTQFVRELQKTVYASNTRVVTLGSRQNMCINKSVKALNSIHLINEKCLEMQRSQLKETKNIENEESSRKRRKKLPNSTCQFYNRTAIDKTCNSALVKVQDIEQLVETGKKNKGCPYFGSRYAVKDSHVIVLPYNLLLHEAARKICKINLQNSIVIIDEAHNLLDTINSIHSSEINGTQLCLAHSQLSQYLARFLKRLKPKNIMYIKQLIFIIGNFIKYFGGKPGDPPSKKLEQTESSISTINEFLIKTNIDNLNLFKVFNFCKQSQIARKLHGFVEKYEPEVNPQPKKNVDGAASVRAFLHKLETKQSLTNDEETTELRKENKFTSTSPLFQIEAFILALTCSNADGRVVKTLSETVGNSHVKFLSLNPASHFVDFVKQAKSVIVAGGTMEPIDEFINQLFCSESNIKERIIHFSCGHVIPHSNIHPVTIPCGPTGLNFEFTHSNKHSDNIMAELGRVIFNICNVTPGGVVCFFASYDYENTVFNYFKKSGVLDKISSKKNVFREPKKSAEVETVLKKYSNCIKLCISNEQKKLSGALLLSVVGGKLSEGINFSDDLGRCVVMVGLPYPNSKSPELKEKMEYLDKNMPVSSDGRRPSQIHYENLCMKAVNQSIGRAIRHKNDYAAIVLIDQRFSRPNILNALPKWISAHLKISSNFGQAYASICKFFSGKRKEIQN